MADFGVSINVTRQFFDRKAVTLLVGKDDARALSRIGSFTRRRARSSMRRRKKPSAPGSPPSAHSSGMASLRAIFFAFDPASQSVVIGPILLNQKHYMGPILRSGTVPAIHEFGGTMGIREKLENIAIQLAKGRVKKSARRVPMSPAQKLAMIRRKGQQPTPNYMPGKKWIPMGRKKPLPGQPTRVRLARYPKRAFMGPALSAEAHNFPSLFVSNSAGAAA